MPVALLYAKFGFAQNEALSIPGPLTATEQLTKGCQCLVDRYVGTTLSADTWKELLDEEAAELTVRYVHGKAEPSTQKVIERLLRVSHCDRFKEIQVADTWLGDLVALSKFDISML